MSNIRLEHLQHREIAEHSHVHHMLANLFRESGRLTLGDQSERT
jgi:hypothetical protein